MGVCNTTQKEIGGKDLILKKCKSFNAATVDTSEDVTITAHGAKVGDIIKFNDVGANTVITTTDFYAVVAVVDANKVKIAAAPGGTAIEMDATETTLENTLVYRTLGGLRSKEFSFSSEAVDVTNTDSNEWKSLLDNSGIRSASVSGSGVYTSEEVFREARQDFLYNALTCLLFLDAKTKEVIEGCFKLTELSISGDYDAEGQYSLSAESAGPVVVFAFP
jgi:TP901-1 family phage major tail protein